MGSETLTNRGTKIFSGLVDSSEWEKSQIQNEEEKNWKNSFVHHWLPPSSLNYKNIVG